MPENGTFMPCPECKSRFWVNKESYARMALKKEGKVYCDKCGKELEHIIVCAECGVMCPDYYLVQASKPPRRQIEKRELFSVSFSLKPSKQTYAYTYTAAKESRERSAAPKSVVKGVGLIVLAALLVIGAGYYYQIKKAENQFAKDYMRALYVMKTGTDLGLESCNKVSSNWKASMNAGQNFIPRISSEEETGLNKIKDATDVYMQKLNKPPKKFINAKTKLANLYGVYSRVLALAVAPSGSFSGFSDSASKSQNDFNAAVQELKGSLPPELSAELKIAKAKYKGLKDI